MKVYFLVNECIIKIYCVIENILNLEKINTVFSNFVFWFVGIDE